jgi:uncharacterized membrane protein
MKEKSADPAKFFDEEEKERILLAIRQAETETSGEIRLHLEKKSGKPVFDRAVEIFNKIGMNRTVQRNGVLIYLATADRQFVILGDEGINEIVPENFWNDVVTKMGSLFKSGKFCDGICEGIYLIGEKLKSHFPYQPDDINELSDDISVSDK